MAERKVPLFGQLDFEHDPNDNEWTSIEEVLYNLNELLRDAKFVMLASNETPWGMMKFLQVAKRKKLTKNDVYPECLQFSK